MDDKLCLASYYVEEFFVKHSLPYYKIGYDYNPFPKDTLELLPDFEINRPDYLVYSLKNKEYFFVKVKFAKKYFGKNNSYLNKYVFYETIEEFKNEIKTPKYYNLSLSYFVYLEECNEIRVTDYITIHRKLKRTIDRYNITKNDLRIPIKCNFEFIWNVTGSKKNTPFNASDAVTIDVLKKLNMFMDNINEFKDMKILSNSANPKLREVYKLMKKASKIFKEENKLNE